MRRGVLLLALAGVVAAPAAAAAFVGAVGPSGAGASTSLSTVSAMRRQPAAVVLAGAVLLLAGFVLASCGGDDDAGATESTRTQPTLPTTTDTTTTTTTTTTPSVEPPAFVRVRVVDGIPRGGIVRRTVDRGDRVVIVVASDVADHVHLHGYDIMRDVAASGTARIRFRATVPGRFEVELEDRGVQIADLTVQP